MSEGGGFKEYLRVCAKDLCNDWDGIASGSGGGSGGGGGGGSGGSGGSGGGSSGGGSGGGILLVEGVGPSGAGNQRVDLYVVFVTFSVVMNLYR